MDELVKEFLSATLDERKAILSKFEEESKKLDGSSASFGKIYVKAAKRTIEKGEDYAKNELERLERILEKSVSASKADEFIVKKNILSSFTSQ